MTHEWKKKTAGALAVFVLAACLAGCNVNAQTPDPTEPTIPTDSTDTSATQVTDVTTEPVKPGPTGGIDHPIGPTILGTAQLKQLRLSGYDANWMTKFTEKHGAFVVINDAATLADVFASLGREVAAPEGYNEDFFADHFLVLIPRGSNSGSVQYVADAVRSVDKITITVEGRMPEAGTTDMADWLLLITLPRDKFPEDLTIEVKAPENQGVDIKDNLDITDR